MGRPPKPQKKTKSIRIYFDEQEMEMLAALARADDFGTNIGMWIAWKLRRIVRESKDRESK